LQGQHYFTDTAGFTIRCNVCGGEFVGEKGATEHAKKTGHYDFGESG
jgi:ubiquitin thioesterase OTU1